MLGFLEVARRHARVYETEAGQDVLTGNPMLEPYSTRKRNPKIWNIVEYNIEPLIRNNFGDG